MKAFSHPRLSPQGIASPLREMELHEIVRILNSKLAVLPTIAEFEIAPARDDAHHREYLTQIRAVPQGDFASVEFRYEMKLADSGCAGFEDIAWDILGRTHRFHLDSPYAELGESARSAVESIVTAAAGGQLPPRLVAVGLAFDFHREHPLLTVDCSHPKKFSARPLRANG